MSSKTSVWFCNAFAKMQKWYSKVEESVVKLHTQLIL